MYTVQCVQLCICLFIYLFCLFLKCLFESTTAQRRSRYGMGITSELHAEAPQATASEGLAEGFYLAARA